MFSLQKKQNCLHEANVKLKWIEIIDAAYFLKACYWSYCEQFISTLFYWKLILNKNVVTFAFN